MPFWDTVMDAPSDIGKRLLPSVVDEIAVKNPERICFSFPRSLDPRDGCRDVSFRTFANAVNKTAHFIRREIGCSTMFETVMYMGHHDIRHFVVLVALMKTGHKALFSSHRNSLAGHADLIKRSDCGIMLYTSGFPVNSILERCRMEVVSMPELDYLLNDDMPCDEFPYEKTFEEAKNCPLMIVHTSGATGPPKPVVYTHWSLSGVDSDRLIPPFEDRPTLWGNILLEASERAFNAIPIFQPAGLIVAITRAIFGRTAAYIGPPGLANAAALADAVEYAGVDSALCVPATLENAAMRPEVLQKLSKLKFIIYTGGSLSKSAGDAISRVVPLYSMIASTETGNLTQYIPDASDWQYNHFDLEINGIEMRPRDKNSNLHELVIVRNPAMAEHQGVFKSFPHLGEEYPMADLYEKHAHKPWLWKYVGRTDDMIVLKSGLMFSPITHEQLIGSHDAVKRCMLVGMGRHRPAAAIELTDQYVDRGKRETLTLLAPVIEKANELSDVAGQLRLDCIIFAKKEKPFALGGKGTVQRAATMALYRDEIERLYSEVGGAEV